MKTNIADLKKTTLIVLIAGTIFYGMSCIKSSPGYTSYCNGVPPASDSTLLKEYAASNGITYTVDTSWLYYQIIDTGSTGPNPTSNSKVTINYVGKFLNGDNFDSTTSPVTYELDSLVQGLQYGLLKIRAGGRIKLLVPSALAFGCVGKGNIPPNTPLYFDVSLINVGF